MLATLAFVLAAAAPTVPEQVVHLANLARREAGFAPVRIQPELARAAQAHAEDMVARDYFDHVTPEGVEFWVRCERAGYRGAPRGENIALGAADPADIVGMWLDSPGHRANILNPGATEMGVGFSPQGRMAVMILGVNSEEPPIVIENEAPQATSPTVRVYAYGAPDAVRFRYAQNDGPWTDWMPFRTEFSLDLTQPGLVTLRVQIADTHGNLHEATDTISSPQEDHANDPASNPNPTPALIFPVLGGAKWTDTFGAPRDGGARQHLGQDLPAPKMHVLLAAFDGVWHGMDLVAPDGRTARYVHLNNDTPGTDDGTDLPEYREAPGIWPGVPVIAGQFLAYCGDSGNAEGTISHLHFELALPDLGTINPAEALRAAEILRTPRYRPERPELLPNEGQLRWDAEVRSLEAGIATLDVAAIVQPDGSAAGVAAFTRLRADLSGLEIEVRPGDYVALLGRPGSPISATGVLVLRNRFDLARGHAPLETQ